MMLWLASFIMLCYKTIQEFLRNNVPLLMTIHAHEIFFILIINMVTLPTSTSLFAALISPLSSSSASCAGVAAVAGEMAKDAKHLVVVEKAGGDFIPLIVECFGVYGHHSHCQLLILLLTTQQLVVVFLLK